MVAALAWTTRKHRPRSGAVVLEVAATHLSVGQQFQPQVLSLAPPVGGASSSLSLKLTDSTGRTLVDEPLQLPDGGVVTTAPLSLPRTGSYALRVSAGGNTLAGLGLEALAEPGAGFGGVTALASFGVPDGVAGYLRQHGFAVTPMGGANPEGEKLILVGDGRGNGEDLTVAYPRLWQQVADGANLLLLEPLAPGVADYWPRLGPLQPASSDCDAAGDEPELAEGLQPDTWHLLRPQLSYDVSGQSALDLYRLDGTRLPRADRRTGYRGCHAVLSYRYGVGWVTVSERPALQHFQDVRARIYLLNLVRAAARRRRRTPPSPGLAWVTRERLQRLAKNAPSPLQTGSALFHRDAPQTAAIPGPSLVPIGAGEAACWSFKNDGAGASVDLNLKQPQPVRALEISLGENHADWPLFRLMGRRAGSVSAWEGLPVNGITSIGSLQVAVPESQQGWTDFRLTLTGMPPPVWRLCRFAAQ